MSLNRFQGNSLRLFRLFGQVPRADRFLQAQLLPLRRIADRRVEGLDGVGERLLVRASLADGARGERLVFVECHRRK